MEDFVPDELAVKLKEKGFNTECYGHYYNGEFHADMPPKYYQRDKYVSAPFISQVLKWLREEKKIFICIDLLESGYCYDIQKNVVIKDGEFDFDVVALMTGCYDTYEQAVVAGIEYVLDNNLI